MSKINLVFILLIAFQIKHFAADFPLQLPYMLKKMSPGWGFVGPLALHCAVHAVMTLAIVLCVDINLWYLALVDFAIHFVMDRIKSGPRYLGRFNNPTKTSFWVALGFDQMVHHLTHIWIIYLLV